MMNSRTFGTFVLRMGTLLLMGAAIGSGADHPNSGGFLAAPPMTAPAIDGRLTSAAEWQLACQITGWVDSILGVANHDGTKVCVGHAGDTLYVLFTCPIPEKYRFNKVSYTFPLKMTAKDRDGDILQDDYVGVSLRPPGSREIYFLGVNGAGSCRDSRNGDISWDGQWQVQQSRDDYVWTLEFAIPLNQFGGSVGEDSVFGVNFAHGGRRIDLMEGVWAYQPAQVDPMAEMRLSPRAVAVAVAGFGDLSEGSLALKGQVTNSSKEPFEGTIEVAVRDLAGKGSWAFGPEKSAYSLKPGEKKDLVSNFDAGRPLCGKAILTIKDQQGLTLFNYNLPFVFTREISLETRFIPTPGILQVVLDLGSPASLKRVTGGQVKITSLETSKEVLSKALPDFQSSLAISDLDCSMLPPGRYEASVDLRMGSASSVLKDIFVKEAKPEWLGNTIGISEKVPVPWSPLKVSGRKITCWGRQYTFGAAGFPSQIKVLGRDILAGPVRVLVKKGDHTEALQKGTFKITEKKEVRAAFTSVSKAGGLKIAADTWMEFDGFVWNTITLQSESPTTIDGLSIEIPLKKEYATLWWHQNLAAAELLNDQMGAPPQQPYASDPLNFLRLGDEEHGIQFFYEDLHHWNPFPGRGQELIPGEKEYVLRYNLIGQPTRLDKPLQFALGYMALPCRPRSEAFRRIDVDAMWSGREPAKLLDKESLQQANWLFQLCPLYTGGPARYECSYFNFWNEEVYDKDYLPKLKETLTSSWETNRNSFSIYYHTTLSDANTPEYRKYRFEWKATPGNAPYVAPDPKSRDKGVQACVCPQSRSYRDFFTWYFDKMVRTLTDDGKRPIHIYQDCGGNTECRNTLHGCPSEGHWSLLANREFNKRIYILLKSINPLNQAVIHTGGMSTMNWQSFCDVMIEGEQFTYPYLSDLLSNPTLPKNYTKILNLERCRAQLQPYAWGPDRYHLYQFWDWQTKEPDEARAARGHLWGLLFCHDVPIWAARTPVCVARAIGELKWDNQVEFVPYWRRQTGLEVKASVSPVVASGWKRGKGHLLVIVMNDSAQTAQSQVRIDFSRFGFKAGEIKCRDYGGAGLGYPDALFNTHGKPEKFMDPQQLPVQDTVVQSGFAVPVEIAQHSFRLLRFYQ